MAEQVAQQMARLQLEVQRLQAQLQARPTVTKDLSLVSLITKWAGNDNVVLRDLTGTECFTFIDDILIFSNDIQEHGRRLEHVLQRFNRANLQLQPGKWVFAQPKVEYLGYVVSRDGI
jgi:ABC-type molybdate transport system ATPase subunit